MQLVQEPSPPPHPIPTSIISIGETAVLITATYLCYKSEHIDLLLLSNSITDVGYRILNYSRKDLPVCSVHSLKIGLRVPITVVKNNDIRSREIDTKPASSGREQEDIFR